MIENNIDEALSCDKQYKKFKRAIKIVFNINEITPDEYYAILQLMNELPSTATMILDETHETDNKE